MEKYTQLFDYSKTVFKDELERFKNIEQKASNYLSALTILLAGAGFFVNWVLDRFVPPKSCLEIILVVFSIVILLLIALSWGFLFAVLRLDDLTGLPLDDKTLEFFVEQKEIDVYYYLSQGMATALASNRAIVNKKSQKLRVAYYLICVTIIMLITFATLYGYQRWHQPQTKETIDDRIVE
jgi:hypothetical protein